MVVTQRSTGEHIAPHRQNIVTTLGELHHGRRDVQPAGWEIREFYNNAPSVLKHALLTISPDERECSGVGPLAAWQHPKDGD